MLQKRFWDRTLFYIILNSFTPQSRGVFPIGLTMFSQTSMIAGIIHLTEATDHMGCIRVYLGSHYLGRQLGLMGNGESRVSTSGEIFFGRGHRNRSRNWGCDLFSLFHLTQVKTQPIKPDKKNSVGTSTQWRRLSLKMKIHTPMLSWY